MEHNSADFDTTLLSQLEGLTTDPLVERIFTKARELEEMINTVRNTTAEEREALVAELDAMWPYDKMELQVSGRLTFPVSQMDDEVQTYYYDDETMISNGFVFIKSTDMGSEADLSDSYKVALHFLKRDAVNPQVGMYGSGLLNDVTIDYPVQSIEMIENRLRYYNADLMQDLDTVILNCNSEEDALIALRDFSIEADPSDLDDLQLLRDLQNYLNVSLEFDRELPYRLHMGQECYVADGDVIKPARADDDSMGLVGINGIQFMPEDSFLPVDIKKKVLPCIDTKFFTSKKDSQPQNILVPTKNIKSIVSLRREMYE